MPDSALLKVELSEVCGTDVHLRDGRLAGVPYPIIPGHVSVGVLEKVGGGSSVAASAGSNGKRSPSSAEGDEQ